MSNYLCADEPLEIGKKYQLQDESLLGFGDKEIIEVELVKDKSDKDYYRHTFKPLEEIPENWEIDEDGTFTIEMATGNFYYPGMCRLWNEGEYV